MYFCTMYKIMNYARVFRKIVKNNDTETLTWFLSNPSLDFKENFDLNMLIKGKSSALHFAIANRNDHMVRLLLEHDARIDLKNKDNENCLELAARIGEHDSVNLCLQSISYLHGLEVSPNPHVGYPSEPLLKYPIRSNAVPLRKKYFSTHTYNPYDIFKFLLSNGANPNADVCCNQDFFCMWRDSPLGFVCSLDRSVTDKMPLIKLLIEHGAVVNVAFLKRSLTEGHVEVTNYLIEQGSRIHGKDFLSSAAYLAVLYGVAKVLQKLIEMNVNVKILRKALAPRGYHETLLHSLFYQAFVYKSSEKYVSIIKLLVEQGADVDALDQDNETPLYQAAVYNCLEGVKYLVKIGANVDGYGNRQPLRIAVISGYLEICKFLISQGADLNFAKRCSRNILYHGINNSSNCTEECLEIIQCLLEKGMTLEEDDKDDLEEWRIDLFESCQSELINSIEVKLCESLNTTYFDVLCKRRNALTNCLRLAKVRFAIKKGHYKILFPKFADRLRENYLNGLVRMHRLNKFNRI